MGRMGTTHDHLTAGRGSPGRLTAVAAVVGLVLALLAPTVAQAQPAPYDRGIDRACLGGAQEVGDFADVTGGTHAGAISCIAAYFITFGRVTDGELVFAPRDTVTRQQMASFVARLLEQVRSSVYVLPAPGADVFPDVSGVHRGNVNRLAAAGIAQGFGDGTFGGPAPVTREQTASFVVRAIEAVTGDTLDRAEVFGDVSGTHRANVEKLASIGVVQGRTASSFAPRADIRRQEMATILARTMDHLVEVGALHPLSTDAGDPGLHGLTDVEVATTPAGDADRITFEFQGEGTPSWRVRYVDAAFGQGTGDPIAVDGDAILQVVFTGMALPFDLPDPVAAQLWDGATIDVAGDGIVQVVSDGIFEGQQVIYVGTTGTPDFTVERATGPTRVTIDIAHTP